MKSAGYPLVFDIARGSGVDGPGLRTTVFFKGCPLRCVWCQNPESHQPQAEQFFDAEICTGCRHCDQGCCFGARRDVGVQYVPDELAALILRDQPFYRASGGGVTFSGGEPLLHIRYLSEVARVIKPHGVHIAVETCGVFDYDRFREALMPWVDLVLYDIKSADPAEHTRWTGRSNRIILENLKRLLDAGVPVIARTPLVPGYTANEKTLGAIARLLSAHRIAQYALLPYNPSGYAKWRQLGRRGPAGLSSEPLSLAEEQRWGRYFRSQLATPDS